MPSLYDLSDSVLERVFQFLPLIHPEPHVFMVSITVCTRLWLFLMNWVEESLEDWFYCRRCHRAWERDSDGEGCAGRQGDGGTGEEGFLHKGMALSIGRV